MHDITCGNDEYGDWHESIKKREARSCGWITLDKFHESHSSAVFMSRVLIPVSKNRKCPTLNSIFCDFSNALQIRKIQEKNDQNLDISEKGSK